jgi:hypothetical protein
MTDTKFLKLCLKDIFHNFFKTPDKNILLLMNNKTKNEMIEFFSNDIFINILKKNVVNFAFTDEFTGFKIIRKNDKLIWDFTVKTQTQEIGKLIEPHLIKYFI